MLSPYFKVLFVRRKPSIRNKIGNTKLIKSTKACRSQIIHVLGSIFGFAKMKKSRVVADASINKIKVNPPYIMLAKVYW